MSGPERRPEPRPERDEGPAEGWRIPSPPRKQPSLRGQLRSARWALLAVMLIINGVAGFWLWTVMRGRQHAASLVAGLLGAVGLVLLDLVAVVLALYAWAGRR